MIRPAFSERFMRDACPRSEPLAGLFQNSLQFWGVAHDKNLQTTAIYLHVTEKKLTDLHSPFDLLRLPKPDDVPPPAPPSAPTPPEQPPRR